MMLKQVTSIAIVMLGTFAAVAQQANPVFKGKKVLLVAAYHEPDGAGRRQHQEAF